MSVLMEFSMFPLEGSESKSADVACIVKMIHESGYSYKLTPMSTVVETPTMPEALKLVEKAYALLEAYGRVYACLKFDIRPNRQDGMQQKIESVQNKLDCLITI
ncbi:thiamine-binding protein [Sulfurospirillum sp.]|uniref:thiamine-binding protein n=1 Tax=Sulfurospirillum sp. TaxID=2053622 RepID=UPI002FDEC95D